MAAAAPIFTAAGAAVPCSAFRRGAGRHAVAAAAAAREFGDGDNGLGTTAAENAPLLPIASSRPTHRVVAEYLYLGGSGTDMRSVTRVVEVPRGGAHGGAAAAAGPPGASIVAALPLIAVDGAATRQGGGGGSHCSALFLKPRSAWLDPLRGGGSLLVLCEAYSPPALGSEKNAKFSPSNSTQPHHHPALSPHPTNNRAFAERAARAAASEEPLFAVTQQYLLCEGDGRPLGWTSEGPPQASCYGSPEGGTGFFPWNGGRAAGTCAPFMNSSAAAASASARGRAVADAHLAACLSAGLAVTGCRAERASGQWSFSLGPLPPLEAADQLWAARWLLRAVAAGQGLQQGLQQQQHSPLAAVTDALPAHLAAFERRWDGNGCRVKFSTRATRDASGGGRGALRDAVERLAGAHAAHMMVYGAGAALRCERAAEREARAAGAEPSPPPSPPATPPTEAATASLAPPPPPAPQQQQRPRFAGVEDSGALLRIPAAVALHGRGHLEDRRPAGGCDPYLAFTLLLCTTLGLPLPLSLSLPGCGGDSSSPGAGAGAGAVAAASLLKNKRLAAKRARCGVGGEQEDEEEAAALAVRRRQQQLGSAAAVSGSGENLCPNTNMNTTTNAAASSLACDEQVAESAQDGEGEDNGGAAVAAAAAAAAAAATPVENFDLDSDSDDDDGGVRSSALLLAEDADDDDEDEDVSTPVTPMRDAADGGATTVAGPDNREASSSPKRSSDLDDDATSSSSNGAAA